jgi:Flp pilus assembly pilin Flp
MVRRLWNDDEGAALVVSEILFIFAIVVLGMITGLVAVRQALISELTETAQALMALNQSFSFSGQSNCESSTAGSSASDTTNTIGEASVAASTAAISQTPCD